MDIKQFIAKEDEENVVGKVELADGQILPADIVIAGIGSTFYTTWLKNSHVQMKDDGTIAVDEVQNCLLHVVTSLKTIRQSL